MLFEWSHVLYSQFDMEDIERRHKKLLDEGEWVYTMSEMEDCSDPVLREFGKYRLDLACHMDHHLAPLLATMLQHYGLYSPVLDLTECLDVALFFATYKFRRSGETCSYEFVGTNREEVSSVRIPGTSRRDGTPQH
jgi:FRG domain